MIRWLCDWLGVECRDESDRPIDAARTTSHEMKVQIARAEQHTELVRRQRATGNWIADGLGDREGRRRFSPDGGER